MKHKKFALLDDGTIEPLYYDEECTEERYIEEENDRYYLYHDVFIFDEEKNIVSIALKKNMIIKESNSEKKLEKYKESKQQ